MRLSVNMKSPIAIAFGRALRRLRESAGLSQEALAATVGMDRTYPSLLERGLRAPTLRMFLMLAPCLGVSPHVLLAETISELETLRDVRELQRGVLG